MNPKHKTLTLDQADYWRSTGLMTTEEWSAYLHAWSQAPRFGSTFCRCHDCRKAFPNRFLPE